MAGGIAALLGKNRGTKPSLEIAIGPSRRSPRGGASARDYEPDEDDEDEMGDTEADLQKTDAIKALAEAFGIDVKMVDTEAAKAALDLYMGC